MAPSTQHTESRLPPTRPPRGFVLHDPAPRELNATIDWARWYVTEEDDMGESPEQHDILIGLLSCLKELARERKWRGVRIAGNSFFGWVPEHPEVQVSPDAYIMDAPPRGPLPKSFQTWRPGIRPPRLAVEVVSLDRRKDLVDAPDRYAQLGCRELIIFDPKARPGGRKPVLTVYRRDADGLFARHAAGKGPVHSVEAGAWFVAIDGPDGERYLRIARDSAGRDLVPTAPERAEAEARHAETEAQRADSETRARHAAEQRVAVLEAELKRRGPRK